MLHPVIAKAHQLLQQIEASQHKCAERLAARAGAPDALEAWQELSEPRVPQWILDRDQREREAEAVRAAAPQQRSPRKWPATMVTK